MLVTMHSEEEAVALQFHAPGGALKQYAVALPGVAHAVRGVAAGQQVVHLAALKEVDMAGIAAAFAALLPLYLGGAALAQAFELAGGLGAGLGG